MTFMNSDKTKTSLCHLPLGYTSDKDVFTSDFKMCIIFLLSRAQEIFKQALQTDKIRLRVIKAEAPPLPRQPPPVLPKPGPRVNKPNNLDLSHLSSPSPIKVEDLASSGSQVITLERNVSCLIHVRFEYIFISM